MFVAEKMLKKLLDDEYRRRPYRNTFKSL